MHLRADIIAAAALVGSSLLAPASAQPAKFICGADKYGQPAHCISATGQPAPPPRARYVSRDRSSMPPPSYAPAYSPQPSYSPGYPAPYSPDYGVATSYQAPPNPPQTSCASCCGPARKRGLLTNLTFAPCAAAAVYAPPPAYYPPEQTYYPPAQAYPQYSYYSAPAYQTPVSSSVHRYRPPPPSRRVYGPWPAR
ncbi:MAG TPA: hypothetical protein VFA53_09750 [Xanthobacteraceae bacterium]|nr:hypothetical protein [Xanthobacteraceae bacterium]